MKLPALIPLCDAVPIPLLVIGPDQRIATANALIEPLFGADVVNRHYVTVLRQPAVIEAIESVFADHTTRTVRYLGRTQQRDTTFHVQVAQADGFVVCAFEDRTAAEDIGKFRRDFVANVSHELRTPLTALMGFIETLQGPARNDKDAQARFLGIMAEEADRMRRLVDDLLSLSRVEDEERVRPTAPVEIVGLITSVVRGLAPVADAAQTVVQFDTHVTDISIPGDSSQLRQVMTNLISNAIKYGGGPEGVTVSLTGPQDEPKLRRDGVRIAVSDRGDGIESHHIPRLTERFYRVDSHRSRAVGGTGLGLAIVKHIVSRHRGRFLIESEKGKGTTMTVLLPTSYT